ncbi:DUF2752 domain-containing protein [Nocardioides pocheonensis]|uniref:DUF2752 domain-containing protein n=1 Tax=Nocardioides pocheonensis TaxID=661485 RepID=A0A3N0GU71_9ACTN|nr:DUF2752 domain-containing protein [Nocardioides pocheonensis]RNM16005.1 DUF2752 domain-containing protein [Nocardioides pocheonensis]
MATLARGPELDRAPVRRIGRPLAAAGAVATATLALRLRDPHVHGSWGFCPFKAITGWDCPLCGGLRAVNDLGHGQVGAAAHSNLLFVGLLLPVALVLWVAAVRRGWTGKGEPLSPRMINRLTLALAAVAVVFTVYRNTPWGSAWFAA